MAHYDHYENGEWVGSSEGPDIVTDSGRGTIRTYLNDGKVRETEVRNEPKYDYSHQSKTWDDIEAQTEGWHIIINFIVKFTFKVGLPIMLIVGIGLFIYFLKLVGVQEFLLAIKQLIYEFSKSEDFIAYVVVGGIALFLLVVNIIAKIEKKIKRKK